MPWHSCFLKVYFDRCCQHNLLSLNNSQLVVKYMAHTPSTSTSFSQPTFIIRRQNHMVRKLGWAPFNRPQGQKTSPSLCTIPEAALCAAFIMHLMDTSRVQWHWKVTHKLQPSQEYQLLYICPWSSLRLWQIKAVLLLDVLFRGRTGKLLPLLLP